MNFNLDQLNLILNQPITNIFYQEYYQNKESVIFFNSTTINVFILFFS